MPRLGVPELLIILVIVLLIFGAGRIPEIGASLGKGIRSFKRGLGGDEEKSEPAKPAAQEDKTQPTIKP